MNKNDAAQYLPLVQALADGKTLQSNVSGTWDDIDEPLFQNSPTTYRIKPEPREIWVVMDGDKDGIYLACPEKDRADRERRIGYPIVRYREVLE